MRSFRLSVPLRHGILIAAFAMACGAGNACAAEAHKPIDPTVAGLQRALDMAARDAKNADTLDPAYQLLSLADTAQQLHAAQVVAGAGAAVSALVERNTAVGLKNPGTTGRDTLDQFVDLRSAAYSAPEAQVALDKGMALLFPAVVAALEQSIAASPNWDDKLAKTSDLAQLQASATQVKMSQVAAGIGAAFDARIAALNAANDSENDAALREKRKQALDDVLKTRSDHLADAAANNIDVMASRMQDAPADGGQPIGNRQTISAKD
jgi:hypothetical protein